MESMWAAMLAQRQTIQEDVTSAVVFCIILILAVLLMWVVYGLARRRFMKNERRSSPSTWSLDDIRKFRDQGQLSQEEFQKLREIVIGRTTPVNKTAPAQNPARPAEDDEEGEIVWQAENPEGPRKNGDKNQPNA